VEGKWRCNRIEISVSCAPLNRENTQTFTTLEKLIFWILKSSGVASSVLIVSGQVKSPADLLAKDWNGRSYMVMWVILYKCTAFENQSVFGSAWEVARGRIAGREIRVFCVEHAIYHSDCERS